MRDQSIDVPLRGIVLTDVRSGQPIDVGLLPGVWVVTLIRHRY